MHSNDVHGRVRWQGGTVSSKSCIAVALIGLATLMVVSLALVWTGAASANASGMPPGLVLAIVKVAALAFVIRRVRVANVYSMQWASMFILLFFAEGLVRATSDPQPSATAGVVEAIAAACTFVALLAYLRPIKKQARGQDIR
jgi:uncharacterized membrane protein